MLWLACKVQYFGGHSPATVGIGQALRWRSKTDTNPSKRAVLLMKMAFTERRGQTKVLRSGRTEWGSVNRSTSRSVGLNWAGEAPPCERLGLGFKEPRSGHTNLKAKWLNLAAGRR